MKIMLSSIILSSVIFIVQGKTLPSDFMLLGLTPTTQLINGLTCQSYRSFIGENTDYLCSKIPNLHKILYQSNVQTREQCQYSFRDHPWGCQLSSKVLPLRRFLRQASKESSFYTTLASATLTFNLINACIKGQINDKNCSCPPNNRQLCQTDPTVAFELSLLITDGINISKNFQNKFLYQINQANKELGRNTVQTMMQKDCRCHGVSGSCELQICRLRPAQLSDISQEIYLNKYKNARYIKSIDHIKPKENVQIIYARKSINYCRSYSFIDYQGIKQGRECFSRAGCQQVCCNRGYEIETKTETIDNCHCFFSWNIVNIQCKPCEKKITRMICT